MKQNSVKIAGYDLDIRRDSRVKGIKLSVIENGAPYLTVPFLMPLSEVARLATLNKERIVAVIQRLKEKQEQRSSEEWYRRRGELVPFRGRYLPLKEVDTPIDGKHVVPTDEAILVYVEPNTEPPTSVLTPFDNTVYKTWWWHTFSESKQYLIELVHSHARSAGLRVSKAAVRDQKTRWGSCTPALTSISLNWRCYLLPPEVCDYIIFHELAHLKQGNHSVHFWAEVEKMFPRYRTAEDYIKKHTKYFWEMTKTPSR